MSPSDRYYHNKFPASGQMPFPRVEAAPLPVVSLNAASYSAPRNENQLISAVARGGFAPCTPSASRARMLSPYTRGGERGRREGGGEMPRGR